MSIDARIPLSVFSNTPDVGAIYQRSMMLKSLAQRQKMDQMQMDEEQRKLNEEAAARQAAAGAVTPQTTQQVNIPGPTLASYAAPHSVPDGSNGPQQSFSLPSSQIQLPGQSNNLTTGTQFDQSRYISNLAGNPQTAAMVPQAQAQFAQQQAQLDQHLQAIRSGQVKLSKDTADAMLAKVNAVGQLTMPIKQMEDSGAPPQQIAAAYQQVVATAQQNGLDTSNLPPQYVPGIGNHLVEQGMAVKDAIGAQHSAATAAETQRHNLVTEQPKPGVDVPLSPAVAAQKSEIARAGKVVVSAPLPGQPGSLDDAAITQAAQMYSQTGQMPALGMGKAAADLRTQIMNRAAKMNPAADLAQNRASYGTYQQQAHKAQPQFVAIDTANQHLDLVGKAAKALENGNMQALNNIANAYGVAVGNDPKTTFDAIVTVAGPEVVKASASTGQMAESEIQKVRSNLQSGMSPKQIESNVAALRGLMDGKKKALQNNLNDLKGGNITGSSGATHRFNPDTGKIEAVNAQ